MTPASEVASAHRTLRPVAALVWLALRAPLALLGLTTLALAPALAAVEAFGQPLGPAAAPVAVQVAAGALLSGVASTSVHGWLWFAAVLPGTWLGAKLRPRFGL